MLNIKLDLQLFAIYPNQTHAEQNRYVKEILKVIRKKLVTHDNAIFSSNWEGDPTTGTVLVPTRDGEVATGAYDILTGVALTQSATGYLTITNFNKESINELIDGYEAAVVPDNIAGQRVISAGYTKARIIDEDGLAVLQAEGTTSANTTPTTPGLAYQHFLLERTSLKKENIDASWAIVSPDFYAQIKLDNNFISAASETGTNIKLNGYVGQVDGIAIYESNGLAATTEFVMGDMEYCQRIQEWESPLKIKDLTNNFINSSALQARWVYKHAVSRTQAVRVKTAV